MCKCINNARSDPTWRVQNNARSGDLNIAISLLHLYCQYINATLLYNYGHSDTCVLLSFIIVSLFYSNGLHYWLSSIVNLILNLSFYLLAFGLNCNSCNATKSLHVDHISNKATSVHAIQYHNAQQQVSHAKRCEYFSPRFHQSLLLYVRSVTAIRIQCDFMHQ